MLNGCWRYVSAIRAIWMRRTMYCTTLSSRSLPIFRSEAILPHYMDYTGDGDSIDRLSEAGKKDESVGSA